MAVAISSSNSSNFGNGITNSPSFASVIVGNIGDYVLYALEINRQNSITIPPATAPTINGQSFTLLQNLGENGITGGALLVYGVKMTAAGTFTISLTYDQYANTSGCYAVFTGVNTSTQIGAIGTQAQWLSIGWTAPTLTVSDGATNDLCVELLGSPGWDDGFNNLSAITWTGGAGQTNVIDQNNTAGGSSAYPRVILSTKAGAASVTMTQTKSSGSPAYSNVAFTIKAAAVQTLDTLTSPVAVGGTGYTGTTTGMGAITSITFAGKAGTITSASVGTFTFSMPTFANGVTYPARGSQTFTVSDGTLTATKSSTVNALATYTGVIMVDPLDTGAFSVAKDPAIVNNDDIELPTAAGTLLNSGDLQDYIFGTYTMWRREAATGTMYTSQLTVNQNGINSGVNRSWIGIGVGI